MYMRDVTHVVVAPGLAAIPPECPGTSPGNTLSPYKY
jgi:hypothetical protein